MHTQSKSFDIVILTDSRYVDPKESNWYINQVILEDKLHFERVKTLPTCITLRRWYYDVAYKQKKGPFFSQV